MNDKPSSLTAPYRFISSRHNPLIKDAFRIKKRSYRDLLLIEGEHAIEMARASRFRIIRVFFSSKYRNSVFLKKLSRDSEVIETTERIISALSDTEHPQGIIAIANYEEIDLDFLPLRSYLLIVCDEIQDPGNLGNIIRTSDAAGADAVIVLPGTCDPLMQKVIRASAGSIFNIPVIFSERDRLKNWIRERKIRLIVTSPRSNRAVYDLDLNSPVALAFGNEARGVSNELLNDAEAVVSIPIIGKAESLNVSVAASICLYEAVRQRISRQ